MATFPQDQESLSSERGKKMPYIRSNSNSGGTGADEEVALSLADTVIE